MRRRGRAGRLPKVPAVRWMLLARSIPRRRRVRGRGGRLPEVVPAVVRRRLLLARSIVRLPRARVVPRLERVHGVEVVGDVLRGEGVLSVPRDEKGARVRGPELVDVRVAADPGPANQAPQGVLGEHLLADGRGAEGHDGCRPGPRPPYHLHVGA
eukprot:1176314-Prorocentrum_minimum.AAC.2